MTITIGDSLSTLPFSLNSYYWIETCIFGMRLGELWVEGAIKAVNFAFPSSNKELQVDWPSITLLYLLLPLTEVSTISANNYKSSWKKTKTKSPYTKIDPCETPDSRGRCPSKQTVWFLLDR